MHIYFHSLICSYLPKLPTTNTSDHVCIFSISCYIYDSFTNLMLSVFDDVVGCSEHTFCCIHILYSLNKKKNEAK